MTFLRRPRRTLAGMGAGLALCATAVLPLLLAGCLGDNGRPAAGGAVPAATTPPAGAVAIARGKVEVQGGLLDVMAPQDGTVESVAVAEGDTVRRGQVLLRLQSDTARADVALAEAELAAAQARQRAQAARVQPARRRADRLGEAARAGALDSQQADDAAQTQREAASAAAVAAADVQVASQKLAQARLQAARLTLVAPQDGTVVRLLAQTGSALSAQGARPVLVLLPQKPLLVRAELNESFASVVKPGMRATVTTDAGTPLPAAKVLRVGTVYGPSRIDEESPPRIGVRVVDCFIAFDQVPDLRIGQDVRVSFHD
ncbi:HlyD family secretion protein [Sphingomonas sp. NCPPB 2930]